MPHPVLQEVQAAAESKDRQAVLAALDRIGDEPALDGMEMLVAGVTLKESGHPEEARQLFGDLVGRHPTFAAGHYELAVVLSQLRRLNDARDAARGAVRHAPTHFTFRQFYIHMLQATGCHSEAEAEIAATRPASDDERDRLEVLSDFGLYVRDHPAGRALHYITELRDTQTWLSTAEVAEKIHAAMDERRGFSLIRLGDGEGAFARISPEDEAAYPALYSWMRREWATALFGPEFDPRRTGYASLVDTLFETAREQDIVGVPFPIWVDHEYAIGSVRGVPCCTNVLRALISEPSDTRLLCDQMIHIHLHREGLLEPLMKRAGRIGLIACHPALPESMKARFGLDEVELFKIPGEKYTETIRDRDQMAGEHFPHVYWDIVRRLSQPHHGRLFVIAAGTLAKFYAAIIRKHGGIALDLGSLVDGWLSIPSRPGYDSEFKTPSV